MEPNKNMTPHELEIVKTSYDFCIEVSNHPSVTLNPTFTYDHLRLAYQKGAKWELNHILKLIKLHIKDTESLLKLEAPISMEYILGMKDLLEFLQKRLQIPKES